MKPKLDTMTVMGSKATSRGTEAAPQPHKSDGQDSLALLKDALSSLPAGLALFDEDGQLILCNDAFRSLNAPLSAFLKPGVHWETLVRETAKRRLPRRAIDREAAWIAEIMDLSDDFKSFEISRVDGVHIAVSVRPKPLGGFIVSQTDITDRIEAERLARESEHMLSMILQASPANLCMSRIGGGAVIYQSPACAALFGLDATAKDQFADRSARADFLTELLASGSVENFPARGRDGRGGLFPALFSARVIEFRGEEVMVSTVTDLTEHVAMERQLAKQRDMLHQSEKLAALGELLAGVAHELNNPLSVVAGHALMLQEEAESAALRRRADKIGVAAERCSRIVKTFLAMARQRPARLEQVDVNATITVALDVAGYSLKSTGARVTLNLAKALPLIAADADQLVQVFANLIVNAEHALAGRGDNGELTFKTAPSAGGDDVIVTVTDNGPGVPDAIRGRIFEPFFTTKGLGEGTGVGLAFCHRIIDSHHGHIAVDNAEGGGARFTIHLPVAADALHAQGEQP